jgi:hypothetical protein
VKPSQKFDWKSSADNFESHATQILDDFLESLQTPEYTIDISEGVEHGDEYNLHAGEGFTFVYNAVGQKLAKKMISKLKAVGRKYFPNEDFDISSHLYKEL